MEEIVTKGVQIGKNNADKPKARFTRRSLQTFGTRLINPQTEPPLKRSRWITSVMAVVFLNRDFPQGNRDPFFHMWKRFLKN